MSSEPHVHFDSGERVIIESSSTPDGKQLYYIKVESRALAVSAKVAQQIIDGLKEALAAAKRQDPY